MWLVHMAMVCQGPTLTRVPAVEARKELPNHLAQSFLSFLPLYLGANYSDYLPALQSGIRHVPVQDTFPIPHPMTKNTASREFWAGDDGVAVS